MCHIQHQLSVYCKHFQKKKKKEVILLTLSMIFSSLKSMLRFSTFKHKFLRENIPPHECPLLNPYCSLHNLSSLLASLSLTTCHACPCLLILMFHLPIPSLFLFSLHCLTLVQPLCVWSAPVSSVNSPLGRICTSILLTFSNHFILLSSVWFCSSSICVYRYICPGFSHYSSREEFDLNCLCFTFLPLSMPVSLLHIIVFF